MMQSFGDGKTTNSEASEIVEATTRQYVIELVSKETNTKMW